MISIYGASDDLIEVDGDVHDEFSNYSFSDEGGAYVYVSTGDVIRFRLEDEGWRANVVVDATAPKITKRHDRQEDDQVTITASVDWVVATTEKPVRP